MNLDNLPPEMILLIIKFLDYDSLKSFAIINRKCCALVADEITRLLKAFKKKFPSVLETNDYNLVNKIYHLHDYKGPINIEMIVCNSYEYRFSKKIRIVENWLINPKIGWIEISLYDNNIHIERTENWLNKDSVNCLHRIGGPAYSVWRDEQIISTVWCENNLLHRVGAPATFVLLSSGRQKKEWWIHGKKSYFTQFQNKIIKYFCGIALGVLIANRCFNCLYYGSEFRSI